jgi:hypothetical protein
LKRQWLAAREKPPKTSDGRKSALNPVLLTYSVNATKEEK